MVAMSPLLQGKLRVSNSLRTGPTCRLPPLHGETGAGGPRSSVDVSVAHDLAGVAAGNDGMLHGDVGKATTATSFIFHNAERFNRQSTTLAAYRQARQGHGPLGGLRRGG